MEIKLNVKSIGELTTSEKEMLEANIWSLLNEVRPDLVQQNVETEIQSIDVTSCCTQKVTIMPEGIKCPHCDHNHENWQDYVDTGDMEGDFPAECEGCGKSFHVKFNTNITFESKVSN